MDRASEINQLHSEICGIVKMTVEKAIRIGELLAEQKEECGHGNWIPWLEANVNFNRGTAWKYMTCFKKRHEILSNVQSLNISIEGLARVSELPESEEPVQPKLSFGEKVDKTFRDELERQRSYAPPSKPENEIAFPVWRTHFGNCLQEIERNFNYEQQKEIAESMIITILAKYPDLGGTKFTVIN